jgi:hypothetical protein
MAVGVVHRFEVVDVQDAQRQLHRVPASPGDLLLQPHLEVLVVVAAGQAVPDGHVPQRRQAQQVAADAGHELLRLEGLGDVVVAADLQAAHALLHVALAGDEDHRRELQRRVGADAAAQVEAVHARHHHVEVMAFSACSGWQQ